MEMSPTSFYSQIRFSSCCDVTAALMCIGRPPLSQNTPTLLSWPRPRPQPPACPAPLLSLAFKAADTEMGQPEDISLWDWLIPINQFI